MRRDHHIVELAEGMIDRQRLDREHVDPRTRDPFLLQHVGPRAPAPLTVRQWTSDGCTILDLAP